MKKYYALTLCLLITNEFVLAQTLKNPGFETGDTSGWWFETPVTYGEKEAGYTCQVVKDLSTGKNFVLQFTSTQNSQWCQLKQSVGYKPADSVERLKISASVKWEGTAGGHARLAIRTFRGGKDYGLASKELNKDTGWTTLSAQVLIAKQTDSLLLFCSMMGPGKAFFDNVRLEKVPVETLSQLPEAKAYLDTALNLISRYALYKDSVDFNALIQQAYLLAADAQKTEDCYAAVRYVLLGLNDHHSFFQTPEQASYLYRKQDTTMLLPSGRKIGSNIGYLKIPPFMAISAEMEKLYADRLQQIIRSIDNKQMAGWIVDNRDNTGGNCFPMLLGLGPVLGDGVFKRTKGNGQTIDSMGYWNGIIKYKDSIIIKTEHPYKLHKAFPKVALLMNAMSASSGEIVILSFKNRPRAKLFGEASYGVSTSNADFTLKDGAMIFICAAKQSDRLGNAYGGKIFPDKAVTDNSNTKNDEVIDAAIKWLTTNK